jgi:hypothetical protein
VDTNTFYSDLGMRGGLRILLNLTRQGRVRLAVPEVVVQEVLKQFRFRYAEEQRRYMSSARTLRGLGVHVGETPPLPDVDEAVISYESELRNRLHDSGATVRLVTDLSHEHVLERAVARRKPFKESGAGYQDTLIWLAALEEAELDSVALISANTADFGLKEGEDWVLAEDLRDDLREHGHDETRVTLFVSIRDFLREYAPEEPEEVLSDFRSLLVDDEAHAELLSKWLAEDVLLFTGDISGEVLRSGDAETSRIENAWVEELDVIDAYEVEGEPGVHVLLRAAMTADLEFDIGTRDAQNLIARERALVHTWGEAMATGKTQVELLVEAEVALVDGELSTEFAITHVEAVSGTPAPRDD